MSSLQEILGVVGESSDSSNPLWARHPFSHDPYFFDTVRLRVYVNEDSIALVRSLSTRGVRFYDKVASYDRESHRLQVGSFSSKITLMYAEDLIKTTGAPLLLPREIHVPYEPDEVFPVDIEFSCHKWTIGVNGIPGIPMTSWRNFAPARLMLRLLGIPWNPAKIEVRRIDVGSLWRMPQANMNDFWASMGRSYRKRRDTKQFGPQSFVWGTANSNTREKLYGKLLEQRANRDHLPWHFFDSMPQRKKELLSKHRQEDYFNFLLGVIRYECEFRTKFLRTKNIISLKDLMNSVPLLAEDFKVKEGQIMQQLPQQPDGRMNIEQVVKSKGRAMWEFWSDYMTKGHKALLDEYKSKNQSNHFYKRKKILVELGVPLVISGEDPVQAQLELLRRVRRFDELNAEFAKARASGMSEEECRLIYIM